MCSTPFGVFLTTADAFAYMNLLASHQLRFFHHFHFRLALMHSNPASRSGWDTARPGIRLFPADVQGWFVLVHDLLRPSHQSPGIGTQNLLLDGQNLRRVHGKTAQAHTQQ